MRIPKLATIGVTLISDSKNILARGMRR